jgi:hypothetical protein
MVSETYINTSEQVIQDSLYDVLYNMSFLLKDVEGKVPDREAKFIARHLNIDPLGNISNIDETVVTSPFDILLGKEELDPLLSDRAISLFPRITSLDLSLIIKNAYSVDTDISSVLHYSKFLSPDIRACMAYLYLETYAMYTSVIEYRAGEILGTSIVEIERVMKNTRFIQDKIGQFSNQEEVYELLNVLRHVQRAILFVKKVMPLILR